MVAKNLAKEKIPIIKHLAVLYMKKNRCPCNSANCLNTRKH